MVRDKIGTEVIASSEGKNASKPTFRGTVVVYGTRTITYNDDRYTLATTDGRVRVENVTPEAGEGTPFEEYWNSGEWERRRATLHKRDGGYPLYVVVEKESATDASTVENEAVLGIDINVDGNLAVTSTGAFLGNAEYLNRRHDE